VQAYLKNVERKREKERAGASSIPDTPATPLTPLVPPTPTAQAAETSFVQTQDEQTPIQSIEHVPEQDVVTDGEFEASQDAAAPAVFTSTLAEHLGTAEGGSLAQQRQEVCSITAEIVGRN
jgi:hypothetical protein